MLAKVIAWAPTREQAARAAGRARCARARIHGVVTNRDLLVDDPAATTAFLAGEVSTDFLDARPAVASTGRPDRPGRRPFAAAVALAERDAARPRACSAASRSAGATWSSQPQRHRASASTAERPSGDRRELVRRPRRLRRRRRPTRASRPSAGPGGARARRRRARRTTWRVDRRPVDVDAADAATSRLTRGAAVRRPGRRGRQRLACSRRCPAPWSASPSSDGAEVAAGQPVLVLEAMKMQHTVTRAARRHGHRDRRRPSGQQVAAGEVLAVVDTAEEEQDDEHDQRSPRPRSARRCAARWPSWPARYGREYFTAKAAQRRARPPSCGWRSARHGYLGINIPEEYGGGGGGIGDVAAVCEELAAQGCPLLMMVVSPAICGTVISRFGTEEQKRRWLPGHLPTAPATMAFAITEPDAGTNSHNITTTARRDGDELGAQRPQDLHLRRRRGRRTCSSSRAPRTRGPASSSPCLFVVPTDAEGFECTPDPDGDRQPRAAVPGVHRRRPAARRRAGRRRGRRARAAVRRAQPRADHGGVVLDRAGPLRARQGRRRTSRSARSSGPRSAPTRRIAHPLAQSKIEIELARLMTQKAAALYDAGDDMGAGEAANMAKYAAAEAACDAADRAVQTHGGNGITQEYGVAGLLVAARAGRIAPVSREMILNFVGMHSLGLPKSY